MPFDTPNLPTLVARNQAELATSQSLRRSDAAVMARMHAGGMFGLYAYLDWLARQLFDDTCDEDALLRHGSGLGLVRKPAVPATGGVTVTGVTGAAVDVGVQLQRSDGALFAVTAGAVLAAGAAQVAVQALEPGALGNTDAAEVLELVSPVLGVNSTATVAGGALAGGSDQEGIDDYRARVIERRRKVPHGGNADDYVRWAKEVPGITRAWTKRNWVGPGTVGVFVVRDGEDPITPAAQQLAQVKAYIETQRPVTAELYALAPALVPVAYRIHVTPDTPRVRAAVEAALQALHQRESDLGATLLRTHITEAISGAAGEVDHQLITPAADVVPAVHQLLVYGGVAWN